MKNKKYLEWQIYFLEEENNTEILGELILNNKYIIKKVFKDTERNYVAQIEIENKYYILKEFRSEVIIPQRKIQTLLKKGEALSTLINTTEAIAVSYTHLTLPTT